jgi:hypothetical protein
MNMINFKYGLLIILDLRTPKAFIRYTPKHDNDLDPSLFLVSGQRAFQEKCRPSLKDLDHVAH